MKFFFGGMSGMRRPKPSKVFGAGAMMSDEDFRVGKESETTLSI